MRPGTFRLTSVLAVVLLGCLTMSAPASADSNHNGRLTFMRQDSAGLWQVWVANADLTKQQQLTNEAANSGWPVWSPDGRKIAFDTDRGDPDRTDETAINDIYTMNANGRNLRNLTLNEAPNGSADPVWSPDGNKILFLQAIVQNDQFSAGLATMNPDGSDRHFISSTPTEQHQPDWQPTCRKCNT